jgi:uroporphyrinogen decarboxylase
MAMSDTYWPPLPREQVIKAVERRQPTRIPLIRAKWWGEGLREQYGARLNHFDRYPEDTGMVWVNPLDVHAMGLSWQIDTSAAKDATCIIDDWAKLDEFIEKMPDPAHDPQFETLAEQAEQIRAQDRYLLFGWWRLFFERPWEVRGMTNLLLDYYLESENIHRLHQALCDQYIRYIRRSIELFKADGFWTSDDLGHQHQPFMRPETFHELIYPYYVQIGQALKPHGVHWWLHSCGNNMPLLPDLIAAGLDVFHPVQKHTMDEAEVANTFGDRLTFLAGIDVQHVLQEKSPDEVRQEVRFLIDTFDRPDGGMCIAAGNGIVSGTPFENIEAFLDEAVVYGTAHRKSYN